jgi:ABC-type microcin C transport system permease subunit YejE
MTALEQFLWGVGGSVAVEIITLYQVYHSRNIRFPERYRRKGFWAIRLFLCLIAGGLAVAYAIEKPILALNIGASAPLIFQALAQGYRED